MKCKFIRFDTRTVGITKISYTLIKLTTGRRREIHPIMYIMTVAFIIHFAI